MRRRKWILVLAAIISFLILAGYVSWHVLKANDKIKNLLLERVRPFLAEESDIDHLELDLNSLHLKGVRIVDKQEAFVLEIEDIRLGYQLWNLFQHRFQPHRVAHEMTLLRPKIILRQIVNPQTASIEPAEVNYEKLVEFIEPIKRISVVEASIVLEDSSQFRARMAKDLNGWIQTFPLDSARIRLSGKVFETDKKNLSMNGKINIRAGRPEWIEIVLDETEAPENMPMVLPPYVKITSGRVQGYGFYTKEDGVSGGVIVDELDVVFKDADLYFENINMQSTIDHGIATVTGAVGSFNGSRLDISGQVHRVLNPTLDLNVSCPRFSLTRFVQRAMPGSQLPVDGQVQLNLDIAGTLQNPLMKGDIRTQNLRASRLVFDTLFTTLQLKDSVFTVRGEAYAQAGTHMHLNGSLDFSGGKNAVDVAFDVNGNFTSILPNWFQTQVKDMSGVSKATLNGQLGAIQGQLDGSLALVSLNHDTLRILPKLNYHNRDLNVKIGSNEAFSVNGDIVSLFYPSVHWELQGQGLEALLLPWMPEGMIAELRSSSVSGEWIGNPHLWQIKSSTAYSHEPNSLRQLKVVLDGQRVSEDAFKYKMTGTLFGESGEQVPIGMQADYNSDEFTIDYFKIAELFDLSGSYNRSNKKMNKSKISVNIPDMTILHPYFRKFRHFSGDVRMLFEMKGPFKDLDWALSGQLKEGVSYDEGVFEGEIQAQSHNGQFHSLQLDFRQNDVAVLKGKLNPINKDSLFGEFKGDLVDLGGLLTSITGKEDLLRGLGTMSMSVSGPQICPVFNGDFQIYDGSLGKFPFNQLTINWLDTLCVPIYNLGGRLYLEKFILNRHDGLNLFATGYLPMNTSDELDLTVTADGNILSILPEVSSFFIKGRSQGYANMRWGGKINEWALGQFDLSIDQGQLEMVTFAKQINNLSAKISLRNEERFLQIERLNGDVQDGQFQISNQNLAGLDPFVLDQLGVSLGVFELSTGEKGVPVHIPGLMEEKEEGWIDFRGDQSKGPFLVGGPADGATLSGTLLLMNSRITYPFLTGDGDSETDMSFLKDINWNLQVVPKQDVHYIKEIKSPFGNVYTDLKLQDEKGQFNVQGNQKDGTLQVWGNLISTEGSLDILDHYFRPERITFNYPKGAPPILSGRAHTTIIDSTGMPSTIWLSVNAVDEEDDAGTGGVSWGNIQFRFSTDNPNLGRTEADLLAALGYSSENLKDRAYDALGNSVDNLVFRPFIRPLEREMRRYLGLDMVRFSSMFSRNLVELRSYNTAAFDPRILLRSTRLMLGKYLAPGFFISYSGQVQSPWGWQYQAHGLGFRHAISLEYAIQPDLFLEMEYTYDSQLLHDRREDKRVWLRHTFPF